MFEIADRLLERLAAGQRIAVATAVSVVGSAPRAVGTSMAVSDDGDVIGSISGGCVEGAVYELCTRVLDTGVPELARFGFSDEEAFAVGLSCGGRIEVIVSLLAPDGAAAVRLAEAASGRPSSMSTVLSGERRGQVIEDVTSCVDPAAQDARPEPARPERIFTERSQPSARFIIFGAVEFSVALSNAAAQLGYRVTVCDARSVFATPARFPAAEQVVVEWPPDYLGRTEVDERTVICILSHDDRFDADLIEAALGMPVAYVGAMGSRSTHARRMAELAARGVTDLAALHSPIGLDIGASTPEETAISILAEVLAVRTTRTAASLVTTTGSIHRPR